MPIRRRKSDTKKDTVYVEFYFWKDGVCKTIYCGVEGKASTVENLRAALNEHRKYRKSRDAETDARVLRELDGGADDGR